MATSVSCTMPREPPAGSRSAGSAWRSMIDCMRER
jgi:hypothetical protein